MWLGAACSILKVRVSLAEIYHTDDPAFLLFTRAVVQVTAQVLKEAKDGS